jgi:hypothetical protein
MINNILAIWETRKTWIGKAWFLLAGIAAVYYGVVSPSQSFRGVAMQRESALAAFGDTRHEHWFQPSPSPAMVAYSGEGVVGGIYLQSRYGWQQSFSALGWHGMLCVAQQGSCSYAPGSQRAVEL